MKNILIGKEVYKVTEEDFRDVFILLGVLNFIESKE